MKDRRMIVKVCGMREADNIRAVEGAGCTWMGFICWPGSKRYVSNTPLYLPHLPRVGVFVDAPLEFIQEKCRQLALDRIQLHGSESPEACRLIHEATGLPILKAISIRNRLDVAKAEAYEDVADFLLFDTKCVMVGGSGTTFDWNVLDAYRGRTPFLLAGGIGPGNESQILRFSHPQFAGIDLNSRFETQPALKDAEALRAFIQRINGA